MSINPSEKTLAEDGFRSESKKPGKSRPLWLAPVLLLGVLVVLMAAGFSFVQDTAFRLKRTELANDMQAITESIRLRLDGDRDYLLMLARQRSTGSLDTAAFQERASHFVADHPELINITWVDAGFVIRDVAPRVPNEQIVGLHLDLPEPRRASRLAMERRKPVYTPPFEAIQGRPSFELWVPVYRGDVFLGLLAGVYSCDQVLRHLVSPSTTASYRVSLTDAAGKVLGEFPPQRAVDARLVHRLPLLPAESGVMLRLGRYGGGPLGWSLLALEFLCLALVVAMGYAMWGLRREIDERRRTEEELRRSEQRTAVLNRIANVFLTVSDEEMFEQVLAVVLDAMASRFGVFGFVADNGDLVVPSMTRAVWSECRVPGKSIVFPAATWGESLWGRAVREQKSFISDGPFHTPEGHIAIDNFLTVPIVSGGGAIGLISVANSERGYGEADQVFMERIADRISPILKARLERDRHEEERKRAEEDLRREAERGILLLKLYETAPQLTDRRLYDYALGQAVFLTGSEIGFFHIVSDDQKDVLLATCNSEALKTCTAGAGTHYPIEQAGNWVDCLRLGRPVVYNDFPSSPHQKGLPEGHVPLRRFMSIPVFEGDKVRFIFGVGNKAGEYGEHDIIHVQLVASELQKIFRQRLSEEALRRAAVYNRGLIEASLDPLVTIGPDGTITDVNAATEAITGCSREVLIGTDFSVYFSDPAKAREGYRQAFRERAVRDYPLEIRNRDGRVTPVLYNASVFRDEGGEVSGVFAAARDVTELRHLETQLRQAQKLEAIGTLAGGVAHDFNNILTAIVGFGSIMEMKMATDDPLLANVKQILAAADRAAALTRSLLAFSRKQSIEFKAVNLNAIVSGMEKMLRRLIREDIELQICLAEGELTIQADAGQIEQVLLNLTTNARDAMESGGTISISTGPAELDEAFRKAHGYGTPGRYALISFTDSGEGIPEDVRQRIFEPFFSTKEVGKGTGLGLSVCYGIVKHHNGFITCYSEPEQGTTFRIYLPLAREEAEGAGAVKEVHTPGGTETLLVAEDDPTVRSLTRGILTEFGYQVVEAVDGEDAVARFRERQEEICLCLFDVIMPKMRGGEAYEEIRKIRPGTKVLFMSGYQEDVPLQKGLVAEGAKVIAKPVMPQELLRKVREALDR